MDHDVFISYSSLNSKAAQAICHELENHSIRCWMAPRDIPAGAKYASVIMQAIRSAKAVVLVFSESSVRSPWVESEINIAFSSEKPIFSYKIDNTDPRDYGEFYMRLNTSHWIDAYPDYKRRFAKLISDVSGCLHAAAGSPEEPERDDETAAKSQAAKSAGAKAPAADGKPSGRIRIILLCALSLIIPISGWILYFVYRKKSPEEARKYALWGWIGFALALLAQIS